MCLRMGEEHSKKGSRRFYGVFARKPGQFAAEWGKTNRVKTSRVPKGSQKRPFGRENGYLNAQNLLSRKFSGMVKSRLIIGAIISDTFQ